MATYVYQCTDCGNAFDVQATIQEKEMGTGAKFVCPKCKSGNIRQEFSVGHFIKNVFKGDKKSCCGCKDGNDGRCS